MEYKVKKLDSELPLVEITKFVTPEEPIINWPEAEKDELKVLETLYTVYRRGVIFIGEDLEGNPIGILAAFPINIWWSSTSKKHLSDLIFYVKPEYRRTGLGKELLDSLKCYAKNKKMSLMLSLFTQKDLEAKEAFVESQGFTKTGSIWWISN